MKWRATLTLAALLIGAACADDAASHGPGSVVQPHATPTATTAASATTAGATTVEATTAGPGSAASTSDSVTGSTDVAPQTSAAPGSTVPPGPLGDLQLGFEPVAHVDQPVALATRPGDAGWYVVSQAGTVRELSSDGGDIGAPVIDVSDRTEAAGERGLLGLAFSLDGTKGFIYYTALDGDITIEEYTVDEAGLFDASSRRTLLTIDHGQFPNHNGGCLVVGADGMLYIGTGDGGGGGDPMRSGQNLDSLLGKILRIDPTPSGDEPYTIPADNPFVGVDGARAEIWSYGLRNPWRFSFDRGTGDLWIGDVGQDSIEEIDLVPAAAGAGRGANFGWSAYEGSRRFNNDQEAPDQILPLYEYPHGDGNEAITGGFVYRGSNVPALVGRYIFADYASGRIWVLDAGADGDVDVEEKGRLSGISSFGEGPDGEMYVMSVTEGTVYRVVAG